MTRIGIIGGTGYTGGELARILCTHPGVEIASMTSRQNTGRKVSDVHPYLKGYIDLEFTENVGDVDLAFVATPHGVAMKEVPGLMDSGVKCIDLSGDYRFRDIPTYELWYGHRHTDPEHLSKAVYGLPELFRDRIKGADLVANPGCYATASILACAPLLKAGIAEPDIDIDAKSGTSDSELSISTFASETGAGFVTTRDWYCSSIGSFSLLQQHARWEPMDARAGHDRLVSGTRKNCQILKFRAIGL